jgi:predicted Zn-dependent protease with MMP-like domain
MDEEFDKLVSDAIDHIPEQYREKMSHVAILVGEEPSTEQRTSLGMRKCDALFGLYEGVPLPKRGGNTLQIPPDRITIFKHPMMELFPAKADLKKQIYQTLWHEVAHFFGLDHSQIHKASKNN